MKAVCIVQARMGSTRLPGKVLKTIGGYPMLEHVLARCTMIPNIDETVLAVPDELGSDELEAIADRFDMLTVRGPECDVLKRYSIAAKAAKADVICRITSDCPLFSPTVAQLVVAPVKAGEADYCSNIHPRSYQKGLDVEAFTNWTLKIADRDATKAEDREHVTPYIYDNPVFRVCNVESPVKCDTKLNWSVDTEEDLERVRNEFHKRFPDWKEKNDAILARQSSS